MELFIRKRKTSPHIFLHLHKCGGTTLMNTIDVNYNPRKIFVIDGSRYRESYNEFKNLPIRTQKDIDLLRGHHFYGAHEYLRKGAIYFTMLREPHARLASLYNYLRDIDLYKEINKNDMSLAPFLDSGLAMAADNGITRMLTNNDFDALSHGAIPLALAEQAINNLKTNFVALGLTEEFDKSLFLFQQKLAWKKLPSYEVKNKTNTQFVTTEAVYEFFDENPEYKRYIKADLLVYEYAKNWFTKNYLALNS